MKQSVKFLTLAIIGFSIFAAPVAGHATSLKKVSAVQVDKAFFGKALVN